jgi:hypothetical protein
MLKKIKFQLLLSVVMVLAFAPAVFAGLTAMGPVNPVPAPGNGFPMWYTDLNGVTVDLPIPPTGDGLTAPTMIYAPVIAGNAYSAQTGFGAEAFYFNARDNKNFNTKDGKGTFLLGLEAGYAGGANPAAGQQVVFARIRFTASVKTAGTYTFFHPWGQEVVNVTATDVQKQPAIKFTKDIGIGPGWVSNGAGGWNLVAAPGGFYAVLDPSNTMSTFLTQLSPAPPAGWIGDGVTPATVTGSPIGYNKVRLQGPAGVDLDGKGHNFIEVTQMIVSGHIPATLSAPVSLGLDRVTCSHIGAVESIDVWLHSQVGATVEVRDAALGPASFPLFTGTVTDPTGNFYASFFPPAPAPTAVTVTASDPLGVLGTSSTTANVIDYVNIIAANYSLVGKTITISATSSDWYKHPTTPPTLTAVGFGTLTFNVSGVASGTFPVTGVLPPVITVNSQLNHGTAALPVLVPGGTDTAQTAITQ